MSRFMENKGWVNFYRVIEFLQQNEFTKDIDLTSIKVMDISISYGEGSRFVEKFQISFETGTKDKHDAIIIVVTSLISYAILDSSIDLIRNGNFAQVYMTPKWSL